MYRSVCGEWHPDQSPSVHEYGVSLRAFRFSVVSPSGVFDSIVLVLHTLG